jgi:hypothetical protein
MLLIDQTCIHLKLNYREKIVKVLMRLRKEEPTFGGYLPDQALSFFYWYGRHDFIENDRIRQYN